MKRKVQLRFSMLSGRAGAIALALLVMFAATIIAAPAVQAQTFSVLYNFTGEGDGANPYAGLRSALGSAVVTASFGGNYGHGVSFQTRLKFNWVLSPLYEFAEGSDGNLPFGGVVIGPNGALYGTTFYGGENNGTVFELRPPATVCRSVLCYWNETVLHSFTEITGWGKTRHMGT